MNAAERREQFIKYYFIQNNINEKNEAAFASSGLWVLIDPVAADRLYKEMEEEQIDKFKQNYYPAKYASKKNGVVVTYAANTH